MAVFDGAGAGGGVALAGLAIVWLAGGFTEGAEARWALPIELRGEGGRVRIDVGLRKAGDEGLVAGHGVRFDRCWGSSQSVVEETTRE
jgi:hypothetical protein